LLGIGFLVVALACASAKAPQPPPFTPETSASLAKPENSGRLAGATPVDESANLDAEEVAAYARARPVFEAYCASCHSHRGDSSDPKALAHFSMDSYPLGGHHAAEIGGAIREVLGANGSKPTMPEDSPGAVKGPELELVLAWAEAFERAHPESNHEHHHDDDADDHHDD
jgi:mono/diheme cytochrome c family protein